MHIYSNPADTHNPHKLPDVEVFELTAHEVAEMDDDAIREFSRRYEFRLASINSRVCDAMLDAIVEENGITGGWCFRFCYPGCLPDSSTFGPYATRDDAIAAARDMAESD